MKLLMPLAVVLFVCAALAMIDANAVQGGGPFGSGSSLEHGDRGLSQARRYLAEVVELPVATLARPIPRAQLPGDAVVFSIMPRLVQSMSHAEHFRHHHGRDEPEAKPGADGGSGSAGGSGAGGKPAAGHADGDRAGDGDQDGDQDGKPDHAGAGDHGDRTVQGRRPPDGAGARHKAGTDQAVTAHPHPLLSPGEEAWIAGGGRLVLAVDQSRGELECSSITAPGEVAKTLPELPGVLRLSLPAPRALSGIATFGAAPVFVRGADPVIMHQHIGLGDLWLLSCPEVLTNQHLSEADHLALLTGLAGGRAVYFDEYSHGAEHDLGVAELLRRWHLGPACLIAGLGLGCWFWRRRTVVGAIADPWRDRRVAAVEGVEAIASLYDQALSQRDCLHLYRSRLLRLIITRAGVKPLQARVILARATDGLRLPLRRLSEREFRARLLQLTTAFQEFADDRLR